jgi:GNAT superfamily N-acetyltransferase
MLPQVRAQGVGQALIEAVYRLADERGAPKVYWQTHEQNYRCAHHVTSGDAGSLLFMLGAVCFSITWLLSQLTPGPQRSL